MLMNPSIVANFFLKKGKNEKIPITIMKLLKLVYIAHGWSLAILDRGLLDKENVEAWQLGPVVPSLYHEFKHFKNSPIEKLSLSTTDETNDTFNLEPLSIEKINIPDKDKIIEILDAVWEAYKEYSAWGLSETTHEINSPWKQTYREDQRSSKIPDETTQNYYKSYLKTLAENND